MFLVHKDMSEIYRVTKNDWEHRKNVFIIISSYSLSRKRFGNCFFLRVLGSFSLHVPSHHSCWRPGCESSGCRQGSHLWPRLEPQHWHASTRTSLENRSEETRDHLSSDYNWNNRGEDLSPVRNVKCADRSTIQFKKNGCYRLVALLILQKSGF